MCSSCAGEFSRHFVCGKLLHGTVFFFHRKKIFNEKKFFLRIFFPEVGKPSTEISRENKNCGFPQKCGRLEALHLHNMFNLTHNLLTVYIFHTKAGASIREGAYSWIISFPAGTQFHPTSRNSPALGCLPTPSLLGNN